MRNNNFNERNVKGFLERKKKIDVKIIAFLVNKLFVFWLNEKTQFEIDYKK